MKKLTALILATTMILFTATAFAVDIDDYWLASISDYDSGLEYVEAAQTVFGGNAAEPYAVAIGIATLQRFANAPKNFAVYLTPPELGGELAPDEMEIIYSDGLFILTRGLLVFVRIEITRSEYYDFGDTIEETCAEYGIQVEINKY